MSRNYGYDEIAGQFSKVHFATKTIQKYRKRKKYIIRTSHSSFTTANFTLKKNAIFLQTEHYENYAYENSLSGGIT